MLKRMIGAGVMALALASTASAQGDYSAQARAYVEQGMEAHRAHGYGLDRTVPDANAALSLEDAYVWPVYLRQGVNYRVYGACDDDCSDLDMELYGADGMLADRDVATDDAPYVQITPTETGRHFVRLWVYACESEPCYVTARVVSGGTPTERASDPVRALTESGDYEQVVTAELEAGGARHVQAGYAQFGADAIAPINLQSSGHSQTVRLNANSAYIFQGACDRDCTNVDMEILDPAGQRVAVDQAPDDRPMVAVARARAGDYVVRIWLANCTSEPCYVGMRSYQRAR